MRQTLLIILLVLTPVFFSQAQTPIKVLLVPGHDDKAWGAQYGNLKEANMNVAVATRLLKILDEDGRFDTHITRDSSGYLQEFMDYFANQKSAIVSFKELAKEWMKYYIHNGDFIVKENAPHNKASEDVSIILYGINKWANENKMDAVIHIHFNDHHRKNKWAIGNRKGFAIYIPETQMLNSEESKSLAESIFKQLKTKYITSNYEAEKEGLVPDQSLIALGSNDTLIPSVRSLLIEYGYIYRFKDYNTRHKAYDNFANLTALGIKEYFFEE